MRRIHTFDYIVENVAQAKTILKNNNISYDNSTFQEILKKTNRDGYTGFITRLVFELSLGLDSALNVYELAKEIKLDIGDKKLNDIIKSDDGKIDKVTKIIRYLKKLKKQEKPYVYLFTENNYKVYLINKYEGIMCTGSPAWCLKTKSQFDNYTKTRRGMQFVAIHEKFAPEDDIFLLTVPNQWKDDRYISGSYSKMRFGITVYPFGGIDIFNDNNELIQYRNNEISDDRYNFLQPILNKIKQYHRENYDDIDYESFDIDKYEDLTDSIITIMDDLDLKDSFSYLAPLRDNTIDNNLTEFYDKIESDLYLNKDQFLKLLYKFRELILQDERYISANGYMDIVVNQMITHNNPQEETTDVDKEITKRTIPLGGYWIDEIEVGDTALKYSYGYQYTKYGKALIEQGFGSLNNFYKKIADNFYEILLGEYFLYIDVLNIDSEKESKYNLVKSCLTTEPQQDGYKITIDMVKLLDIKKNHNKSYLGDNYTVKNLSDDLKTVLSPFMKNSQNEDYTEFYVYIHS